MQLLMLVLAHSFFCFKACYPGSIVARVSSWCMKLFQLGGLYISEGLTGAECQCRIHEQELGIYLTHTSL